MVIVIMGAAGSGRDSLGQLLAESLGWEFVDGDDLRSKPQSAERGAPRADSARAAQIEALCAALQFWNYHWRDVVVTCSMMREQDQQQLSNKYASVKFVHLQALESPDQTAALAPPVDHVDSGVLTRRVTEHNKTVLTVNSSQRAEQIVAELISVLILNRWPASLSVA
jgi:gluconate kinase